MSIVGKIASAAADGITDSVPGVLAATVADLATKTVNEATGLIGDVLQKIVGDGAGYITKVVISNETSHPIQFTGRSKNIHGDFEAGHTPATGKIEPGQSGVFGHTASAGFYGSEGSMAYTVFDPIGNQRTFTFGWDNVYSGTNRLRLRFGENLFVEDEIDDESHHTHTLHDHGLAIVGDISPRNGEETKVSITVGYPASPSKPYGLDEDQRTGTSFRLKWEGKGSYRYKVLIAEGSHTTVTDFHPIDTVTIANGSIRHADFRDLTPNTAYSFCVVAINGSRLATRSDIEVFRTESEDPVTNPLSAAVVVAVRNVTITQGQGPQRIVRTLDAGSLQDGPDNEFTLTAAPGGQWGGGALLAGNPCQVTYTPGGAHQPHRSTMHLQRYTNAECVFRV